MSHAYEEQEILWYYNIPDLSRESWDGIKYESIRYGWDELDYRFSVEYPSVPEPSFIGLFMGLCLLTLALIKRK
jgi:hypothetical protein